MIIYTYTHNAFRLNARRNTQSMCSQPSEAYSACNTHTACITNTSHMHSKPSATCHYSQLLKRREALEHALRQRRDLVAVEVPAQAHKEGESGEVAASHTHVQCIMTRSLRSMLVAHVCDERHIHVPAVYFNTYIKLQANLQLHQVNKYTHLHTNIHTLMMNMPGHSNLLDHVEGACVISLMCICENIFKPVYTNICIRVWLFTRRCIWLPRCMHMGLCVRMHECEYICMYVCEYICMSFCVSIR